MDFRKQIDKLLAKISETLVSGIKQNIKRGLFGESPYGAPLDPATMDNRKRRGITSASALYDTGSFYSGLAATPTSQGISIGSSGISDKAAAGAFFGKGRAPVRNPYNLKQPIRGKTMEDLASTMFADGLVEIAAKYLTKNGEK